MTRSTDLIDEVNILRRELEKLELGKRIAELKTEPFIDEGLETIVKKQNQTLLHIKAELEFIKQHPFDLVLVGGSIENMSRVIEGQTEPFIDEGCAGCCKVADVAAKLQKELDEYKEAVWLERIDHKSVLKTVNQYHHAKIKDLEDDNSSLRDTIDQMAKKWSRDRATIKNFKTIETRETDRLHKTILDMDVTISDLMGNDRRINGFLDEYRVTVDNRDKTIASLEAELSARKEDSVVLKRVVETVKNWDDLSVVDRYSTSTITAIRRLYSVVKDYTDAPEGPPETPIDESDVLKKIRVLVDDWSVNKKGGKQSFFILSEIDDMLKSTQHIDEKQDITVTFAYLELP